MTGAISSTRLERSNQLARERVAKRGHKLLKDKSTEMLRNLQIIEREAKELREKVEQEIAQMLGQFAIARAFMSKTEVDNAIQASRINLKIEKKTQNIMGLVVPRLEVSGCNEPSSASAFVTTHPSFDKAVGLLVELAPRVVDLGCKEKACIMLEAEIKSLRRRINALEYRVIPQIRQNIRYITFKLAENERGNLVRLMKVKQMQTESENK